MSKSPDLTDFRFPQKGRLKLQKLPTKVKDLYKDETDYLEQLGSLRDDINEMQEQMFAHNRHAMLVVFQAMDAAGKDSTIEHVFSGVNPEGVDVTSFKRPSDEELDHDFLWRTTTRLPPRGKLGIFNRSYYEEVLICKVHDEFLTKYQRLPEACTRHMRKLWKHRYESIRDFERHMGHNGTHVVKFFLNVSKREQAKRFLSRIEDPSKNWKFNEADLGEREHWKKYMSAYEDAVNETATEGAPWYVIPADNKKNMRLMVAMALRKEMKKLELEWPQFPKEDLAAMVRSRKRLMTEVR
jgi:PPK2 family polyphosphate:nucleotide phosphotransferase